VQRFAALFALLVPCAFPASALAAKVPKALCLTWQSNLIQGDNITLDVVIRPVQGRFETRDVTTGRVAYKLYSLHGLAGMGSGLPGPSFPTIGGSAILRTDSEELNLGILLISDVGTYTFRGLYPLAGGAAPMRRIAPDGVTSEGEVTEIDCSGETVESA
jgi:hypothetical protein